MHFDELNVFIVVTQYPVLQITCLNGKCNLSLYRLGLHDVSLRNFGSHS